MGGDKDRKSAGATPSGADLRRRLALDDAALLTECDVHLYKASGPGGQHRNKVTSAVRLHHRPSGLTVTGTERRSQHENKANAVKRLREALAVHSRAPLPAEVTWPPTVQVQDGRLRVNEKNPAFCDVLGLVLDALAACEGRHQDAAAKLGVSGSSLVRFLAQHGAAWAEANRIRAAAGLGVLKK